MQLATLLACGALAMLGTAAAARETAREKKGYDPEEVVCKSRTVSGSRLVRIRECATRQQWDELKQQEQLGLMRKQYNGAQ